MKATCAYLAFSLLVLSSCRPKILTEGQSRLSADISNMAALGNGIYTIRAVHSGLCLDVPQSSTANGVQLQQWNCNGTNAQNFEIVRLGGDVFKITNVNSKKSLDIRSTDRNNGAAVQQWDYVGQPQQHFRIEDRGGGRFSLTALISNYSLDVTERSTAVGAKIQQWGFGGGTNQMWFLSSRGGIVASNPPPVNPPAANPPPANPPPATGERVHLSGRGIAKYHLYTGLGKCFTALGLDPAAFGMMVTAGSTQIYNRFPGMLKVGRRGGPYDPTARCVKATAAGGRSVTVRIIDKCCGAPLTDPASHQLDLSEQAFAKLAPLGQGNVAVDWQLIDCPNELQVKNDAAVCNDDYYYNL